MTQQSESSIPRSQSDRADGFDSRNRGLQQIDQIFKATGGPASFIENLLKDHSSLDVLEVGFGWGFALLELARRFRNQAVSFHGVDIEKKPEFSSPDGIVTFARENGIVAADEVDGFKAPSLFFYDASQLHFCDESMDFVYSAITIRFLAQKIEFIEEVARVLRPGGKALLHLGESNWDYPYGRAADQRVLTPFTSRLVLKYGEELIPLPKYFSLFNSDSFEFEFAENSRCILIMSKLGSGKVDFGLKLNTELTLPGREVPLVNRKGELRGGIRSVYDISTENYQRLVNDGMTSAL